ncbi:MAG: hypothetical protein HKL85_08795 [Acidimicrobiaceae bacterium]|nr:hypothetical protein [Acidimicrobiaceae bacterium]
MDDLLSILKHPAVQVTRYVGVVGRECDLPFVMTPGTTEKLWVEMAILGAEGHFGGGVARWGSGPGGEGGQAGLWGDDLARARLDPSDPSYPNLSLQEGEDARWLAAAAALAASNRRADILVTRRPYLFSQGALLEVSTTPCTVADAIEFVGFWLRQRAKPSYWANGELFDGWSRWDFYRTGALTATPYFFLREEGLIASAAGEARGTDLVNHAFGVLRYFIGALWARDDLHLVLNFRGNEWDSSEAHHHASAVLLNLLGACDALAGFVRERLAWTMQPQAAALHRSTFQEQLEARAPSAWAGFTNGHGREWTELLNLLRNTIHGVPLLPHHGLPDPRAPMSLAGQNRRSRIEELIELLHPEGLAPGISMTETGDALLLPGPICDVLIAKVASTLEAIALGLRDDLDSAWDLTREVDDESRLGQIAARQLGVPVSRI